MHHIMKNRLIEIVAFILGVLTALTGALTLPAVAMLPASWQPYVGLALALVVVGKNGAYVVLDFCDNGLLDNSYKAGSKLKLPLILLAGLGLMLMGTSCATRPDGTKTFLALDGDEWMIVGGAAGRGALQGALQSGLPAYQEQRQQVLLNPSGKTAVSVVP